LNDIALIQLVEKKPKTSGEFVQVAGGALSSVAKAHASEVIAIIRDNTSTCGITGATSLKSADAPTPSVFGNGSGSYLLEVSCNYAMVTVSIICVDFVGIHISTPPTSSPQLPPYNTPLGLKC
jgi:hypothetical protein